MSFKMFIISVHSAPVTVQLDLEQARASEQLKRYTGMYGGSQVRREVGNVNAREKDRCRVSLPADQEKDGRSSLK